VIVVPAPAVIIMIVIIAVRVGMMVMVTWPNRRLWRTARSAVASPAISSVPVSPIEIVAATQTTSVAHGIEAARASRIRKGGGIRR
jgi:hypothetical protein